MSLVTLVVWQSHAATFWPGIDNGSRTGSEYYGQPLANESNE
jgi:hypothetical protein